MFTKHLLRFLFAKSPGQSRTLIASGIRKGTKLDKQFKNLKRSLFEKQPIRSESLYDEYHHTDVYKRIDTDLEAFFYKREYSIDNFNFLINLLGHQKKLAAVPEVLEKMHLMKIEPDDKTYNYIIRAAAHEGNTQAAQKYLQQAREKFGESKYFYTSLMQAYTTNNDPDMAYKILQEMVEKNIQPDLVVYTSLVNALRIGRKLEKCWELNKLILKSKVPLDENYVGVMLKVYAATHDAQKAIRLYQQVIIGQHIKPMLETVNSYFKALSNRPQYSIKVIDKFMDMIESGEIINEETVRWALRACATTANLRSAIQIVKIMKLKQIEPTVYIYNSLIRTYANACLIPQISEENRQLMLTDTWKLLEQVISKNMLDTHVLNNVMLVYANALEQDKIQGLILPLFDKFNLEMNPYTYEVLMDLQYNKKDFNTAIKVWQQMHIKLDQNKHKFMEKRDKYKTSMESMRQDFRPTFNSMEQYIQIGIRLMDMKMILDGLEMFKKLKRHPKNSTLKFLGNLKKLPIEIQTSLMDFQIRFGAAKFMKTKTNSERNVSDPQDN